MTLVDDLVIRQDINRELVQAGMLLTKEDTWAMRNLLERWDGRDGLDSDLVDTWNFCAVDPRYSLVRQRRNGRVWLLMAGTLDAAETSARAQVRPAQRAQQ